MVTISESLGCYVTPRVASQISVVWSIFALVIGDLGRAKPVIQGVYSSERVSIQPWRPVLGAHGFLQRVWCRDLVSQVR